MFLILNFKVKLVINLDNRSFSITHTDLSPISQRSCNNSFYIQRHQEAVQFGISPPGPFFSYPAKFRPLSNLVI